MSKSIEPVIKAFWEGKPKKVSNTETDGSNLWLFGNCIAKKGVDGVYISTGGYKPTKTTQNRISMLGVNITMRKGLFYINNIYWDGTWISINNIFIQKEIKQESLFV